MFKRLWQSLVNALRPTPLGSTFSGQVVGVVDGDTLDVRVGWRCVRIRLAGIDAPEARQRFGLDSTQHLAALAYGRRATVERCGHDRFGRMLARVVIEGKDVSQAQLDAGLAWHVPSFSRSALPRHAPGYGRAAGAARAAGRGLWRDAQQQHPAQFRHQVRKAQSSRGQMELFR